MAKLNKKDVEHIAQLARLNLTEAEILRFQKQLSEVVSYVEELSEVDTSKVLPTSQTTGLTNIFRGDEIDKEGFSQEDATGGTKNSHNGYFIVPQILEKGGKNG